MPESSEARYRARLRDRFELVNGEVTAKVSPRYNHASVQGRFYRFIDDWCV
ncbi:hypothetical protein [Chlorogloea sp. CCALA 695]|uniref:hypothetical protein n=1 Tax=Chlorogloea sp. CCALA 695 TaxID=2107693 RepID=UPI0018EB45BB|nr:hypothetical protein [Chlorogloea sp. CCALA 695]